MFCLRHPCWTNTIYLKVKHLEIATKTTIATTLYKILIYINTVQYGINQEEIKKRLKETLRKKTQKEEELANKESCIRNNLIDYHIPALQETLVLAHGKI